MSNSVTPLVIPVINDTCAPDESPHKNMLFGSILYSDAFCLKNLIAVLMSWTCAGKGASADLYWTIAIIYPLSANFDKFPMLRYSFCLIQPDPCTKTTHGSFSICSTV